MQAKSLTYSVMALPVETADQKTFSIIMATYNCGRKVENTLHSIFSQNRDLFELIVFDGASTDDTLDYLKKYETDELLTLISEKDEGVYDAFNKAIDLATGKYVYFIGAGDCLQPDVLERVKEFLPDDVPSLVYGKCYFVKQKIFDGREFSSFDFTWTNICHQGEFYHRAIFKLVGKYDSRYKVFADWLLNFKCFTHQGINKQFVPLHIADYEEGGLSSRIASDPAFRKDFPRFVKRQLGVAAYLVAKTRMLNPDAFYYCYATGYKILGLLGSAARPFVRCGRRIKNAIIGK